MPTPANPCANALRSSIVISVKWLSGVAWVSAACVRFAGVTGYGGLR
jgi:hypothetical protein